MYESSSIVAEPATDLNGGIEAALRRIEDAGVAAIPDAMAALDGLAIEEHDEAIAPLLTAVISALAQAFSDDPVAPAAYAALPAIPAPLASLLFDEALILLFGDGPRDIAALSELGALCLINLLSAADAHEQTALLIAEARQNGFSPALGKAAWFARCRWAGCDPTPAHYLADARPDPDTPEAATARIDAAPLDPEGHRAHIRGWLAAHDVARARDAAAVALALPVGDSDKAALVPELTWLLAAIAARGELPLLQVDRLRWAMAIAPGVTEAVATAIAHDAATGKLPFLDPAEAADAVAALRGFIARDTDGQRGLVTGFPMRDGKPHVDTVWLEITNHCNQKCTFCPDMFREDARTWLPLEQVKQLIDQLADTISVGSMQLNAYGEPLLHPNIAEILTYIRERRLPWPTYFTSHGMTLVDKKLKQLSNNYPSGIAISLHNDGQDSYEATRSYKIGDYETLVSRVRGLLHQMAHERAPTHLRLYQMVSNENVDLRVDEETRTAFPGTAERMRAHVRKWEAIAAEIAATAPAEAEVRTYRNDDVTIELAFMRASHDGHDPIPILSWMDAHGERQFAFMSARPVGTYANLLLEYDPRWEVKRKLVSRETCGFTAAPSLAIFATGRLGLCCLDLNSTATFGALSDFDTLHDALTSPAALRMVAQLSNGVATSRGCQICLGDTERHCASKKLAGPARPVGHFREAA